MRSTLVAAQCRADTALTLCCSGGGLLHPWSSGLAPVSSLHFKSSENTKVMAFGTVKASENAKIVAFRTVKASENTKIVAFRTVKASENTKIVATAKSGGDEGVVVFVWSNLV